MKEDKFNAYFTIKVNFEMDEEGYQYVDPIDIMQHYVKQMNAIDGVEYCRLVNLHMNGENLSNEDFKKTKEQVNDK